MTALRAIAVAVVAVWTIALPCWAVICLGGADAATWTLGALFFWCCMGAAARER